MRIKQNLDEVIYQKIIDSLILREYEMGEHILLDSLAEKYGVSRTPIVQAVRLLANDGVLEMQKNGRVRVPIFTQEEIHQVLDIRLLLETYSVDEVVRVKTDDSYTEWSRKLKELADSCSLYINQNDLLNFNRYDLKFHTQLVKGSENVFLVDLYKRIQGRFVVANYLSNSWDKKGLSAADLAHHKIAEALEEHKIDECKSLMEKHIYSVYHVSED